jgi:DNA polymerase III alpha subunit
VDRPDVARVLEVAARLDGLPRHTSVHVGGVVIADRRLTDYVPLEAAAKGVVITQYEAEAVEAMGLVKMDILAQRSLSILETAVREIEKNHGRRVDPSAIADGDPRAAALLATGDTFGCFQIESPGMRGLLRMMGAKGRMDVILGLSLIRPGPASSGMKERFVRRRRGIEPPEYLHPSLREVLGDTYGVMLYQEDVIRVAHAAAGFPLAEGDRLRKDLAKGAAPAALAAWRTRFVRGAVARGASRPDAETLWDRVAQFAAYSYCKAHASTYGEIAYRAVYLRARWPAEFAAAVLANQAGYYERRTYVEDARRHGVPILGPDVSASEIEPTSEVVAAPSPLTGEGRGEGETPVPLALPLSRQGRGDPARRRSAATPAATPVVGLRIGLMDVHELSERAMRQIVEERRAHGPYRSVGDLLGRVRLSRQEAENLAMAGGLDSLAANRPQALWQVHACLAGGVRPREGTLWAAPADPIGPAAPPLEDYSPLQKLRLEEAMLGGITPSAGPMSVYYGISDFGFRISDSTENGHGNDDGNGHGNHNGNGRGERLGGALHDKRSAPPRQPRENGLARTCDLARHAGREVTVLGLVFAERRARTKTGEFMKFLSFEDPWGVVEAVFLPDAYQRLGGRITTRGPYRVTGTVEAHYGALALKVKDLAPLATGHASPGP